MMTRLHACLLIFSFALTSFSALSAESIEKIVAVVNDDVVLQSELTEATNNIESQIQQSGGQMPSADIFQRKVLERLVLNKVQLQHAQRNGVNVTDDQVNNAVESIAQRNNMNLASFARKLKSEGMDYLSFRSKVREEMIVNQLRQRMVDSRVQVTEREVDDAIATLSAQARNDISYRLQHILIAVPEGSAPEELQTKRKAAEKIIERLDAGENFEQLAVAYSDGQNALEGGDLGWRKLTEIPTLFVNAINTLKPGEFSRDVIQSPSGFHLLRLAETKGGDIQIKEVHARHILVQVNQVVDDASAKLTLKTIQKRLANGESFAKLAQIYSDDSGSKEKGGDLGWQEPSTFVSGFEEAVTTLPIGQVSAPIKSRFGYHIIQVLERRERDVSLDLRRDQIRNDIANRKRQEDTLLWQRRLLDEAYIEYRL